MLTVATEVAIVLLLIVINGLLSMSELAIVSARKHRLQQRAAAGDAGAGAALALADEPNRFLSTVQIGITLVGVLTGAFGGATLARAVAPWLAQVPALAPYSEPLAVALVVLFITYLTLILGELVPKRLALHHAERIAARVARPMRLLARLAAPAVVVLSASTEGVLRLFGVRPSEEPPITEEEITLLVEQGARSGVLDATEQDIVKSVFRLGDRRVAELMTPRLQMVWLDADAPAAASWDRMLASSHSRFPVCRGNTDNVVGVVHVKDLWAQSVRGQPLDLQAVLRTPLFVPDSQPALRTLAAFRESGIHLALVLDEYGGTAGLVTLTDVLEALVGEVTALDELPEPGLVQREDGSWLVDGLLPTEELKAALGLAALPDEDEYQTVSGLVMLQLGRVPRAGDYFVWGDRRFEVVDMDGRRVDKVLVQRQPGGGGEPAP